MWQPLKIRERQVSPCMFKCSGEALPRYHTKQQILAHVRREKDRGIEANTRGILAAIDAVAQTYSRQLLSKEKRRMKRTNAAYQELFSSFLLDAQVRQHAVKINNFLIPPVDN
jgi:hypothetical protein